MMVAGDDGPPPTSLFEPEEEERLVTLQAIDQGTRGFVRDRRRRCFVRDRRRRSLGVPHEHLQRACTLSLADLEPAPTAAQRLDQLRPSPNLCERSIESRVPL